jgi:MFS family permease
MTSGIDIAYSEIRQNKKMLFLLFGFISGMLGALLSEFIFVITPAKQALIVGIFTTALWAGLFSAVIATGLFYAIDIYGRRKANWVGLLKKSIPAGFIAGAVSGGVAQAIFGPLSNFLDNVLVLFLFQSACWSILGLILGWRLSQSIPNLGTRRALYAGFAGGFIGGAGFLIIGSFLDLLPGHMLGIGILGAALGFCVVIVEEQSRTAYLEVHWAPNDISFFTLGSTPVFIGSGDSDICVPSVVRHGMSLVIEEGQIIGTDRTKGKKKQLFDGNHITIGKIDMIIRTGIEKMKGR